jgi:hypothetical protein
MGGSETIQTGPRDSPHKVGILYIFLQSPYPVDTNVVERNESSRPSEALTVGVSAGL